MTDESPEELRRRAEEILDRPEFAEPDRSALERALSWVGDRFGDLLSGLAAGDVGSLFLLGVVVGAVVALLLLVRRRLPLVARSVPEAEDLVRRAARESRAREWRERADAARAQGDWAEAVRCEHRYSAAWLDDRAMLRERDDRTARELLEDVKADREVAGSMHDITGSFEDVWYGDVQADEQLADAVRRVGERIRDHVERSS